MESGAGAVKRGDVGAGPTGRVGAPTERPLLLSVVFAAGSAVASVVGGRAPVRRSHGLALRRDAGRDARGRGPAATLAPSVSASRAGA